VRNPASRFRVICKEGSYFRLINFVSLSSRLEGDKEEEEGTSPVQNPGLRYMVKG